MLKIFFISIFSLWLLSGCNSNQVKESEKHAQSKERVRYKIHYHGFMNNDGVVEKFDVAAVTDTNSEEEINFDVSEKFSNSARSFVEKLLNDGLKEHTDAGEFHTYIYVDPTNPDKPLLKKKNGKSELEIEM